MATAKRGLSQASACSVTASLGSQACWRFFGCALIRRIHDAVAVRAAVATAENDFVRDF